ncbi:hypothetical protein MZD04_gp156 [Pseudomonas phage Psa21]|uniref:Uncharacterized protein n=1 Tax=Pseudomonas phage Psa21 TaxID=2530023 RepID=A0A481W5M5_9CAUD|nr:hypothetical protein MZD04_gp156 [Pseudomonas phage Psa21]QBJ02683.1 hypothetical protein PSA21_156 [Pseudomonas phage Psa21]
MAFVEQTELSPELIKTIDGMTKEFVAANGRVTCEVSIQECFLVAAHNYIHLKNKEFVQGIWVIYKCDTCVSYSEKHPYHLSIERIRG